MGAQRRIGELLVEDRVITAEQRDRAIERQVVHGGRLGTNLVEIFALGLDELAYALGKQHGLPAALQKHFQHSDPEVQCRLLPELAAQWHVVPIACTEEDPERVALAGTDPLPTEALRELEEVFGRAVVFAVAPELRLLYHLEKVYGVERLNRFKRIATPVSVKEPETPGDESAAERRRFVRTLSDSDEPVKPPGALAKIAVKRIAVPASGEVVVEGRLDTIASGVSAMRRSTARDKVGDVLIETLKGSFDESLDVGMILIVRQGLAIGWKGFVRGQSDDLVEAVALPLDEEGVLQRPYRHRDSHFGAPASGGTALDRRLWRHLGTGVPAEIAVVPVELFGEIACLLYAHSAAELPPQAAGGIAELSQGMAAAFHRLVRAAER